MTYPTINMPDQYTVSCIAMNFGDEKKLHLMFYSPHLPQVLLSLYSLPLLAAGICNDFSFKCKNKQCVNKVNAECDREEDCSDGSDEQGCGKSHF